MTLFMCTLLTGCGLKYLNPFCWPDLLSDAMEEAQDTSNRDGLLDFVTQNSTMPQKSSTLQAGVDALEKNNDALTAKQRSEYWHNMGITLPILGWNIPGIALGPAADVFIRPDTKAREAASAERAYENAVATDEVLQSAYKEANGEFSTRGFDLSKIPLQILVLVALFIFLFLWVWLRILKAKRKAIKKGGAKYAIAEAEGKARVAEIEAQTKLLQVQHEMAKPMLIEQKEKLGTDDGQQKLLHKQCNKRNLNPDKVLAACNGDVFAANELILSTPPEQLVQFQ